MAESRVSVRRGPRAGRPAVPQAVEIREIGAGGAGVGNLPDGRVVFVHGTAPGEQAVVQPTDVRKDWARARLVSIVRPGPGRTDAACPLVGECGGCTVQHLRYDAQLSAKADIVRRALQRIGHVAWGALNVEPSPREFGYRNRLSFSLVRLGAGHVVAGFHALEDPARIVDVREQCVLPEPAVAAAWSALRREWGRNAFRLPAGRELRLTLRAAESGPVTLLVEGGHGPGRPEELLELVPGLTAIWHRPAGAAARLLAAAPGEGANAAAGNMFVQVNREAARRLEARVIERAAPGPGLRVVDAYCGTGVHARAMAGRGADVTGIEVDPEALAEARQLAGAGVAFLEGRVEDRLPAVLPADLVIVNPPRAGLGPAVVGHLLGAPPRRLFYVSCDPATLARDIDRLRAGFRLSGLTCFDLFPQTAHVETLAELECSTT